MKRSIVTIAALLLCVALLAGCAGDAAPSTSSGSASMSQSQSQGQSASQSGSGASGSSSSSASGSGSNAPLPNPHLGTWYNEDTDTEIIFRWDETCVIGEEVSDLETATWFWGGYELDGTTLTTNEGDTYEYHAQDDTMQGGGLTFERKEYTGDRITLSGDLAWADIFTWGDPSTDKQALAQEIIAVWDANGETVDAQWRDPDTLIDGISAYIGDEEYVFIAACAAADVDVMRYNTIL